MLKKQLAGLLAGAVALSCLATFAGCTSQPSAPTAASTSAPAGKRQVVDMAGRTVTLNAKVDSVATFGTIGVLNTFVELFGDGPKIVNNMSASFTKTDQWKYQNKFAPQLSSKPVFENANREIQMETVLAATPDVSFTMMKDYATQLEKAGLPVVYLEWRTIEDVPKAITLMGEVLNKQDVAKDYLAYFDKSVADSKAATSSMTGPKKKVFYGSMSTMTNPHIISEWWIAAAGGDSVTQAKHKDETMAFTIEELLSWNPDVIFSSTQGGVKAFLEEPRLANVKAVKDGAVYTLPTVGHTWGNRTVEQPLTIKYVMNKLYPEIMPTEKLKGEITTFYAHYFNYKMSDEEVAEIIGKK